MSLFDELKRRNVFRVGVAYLLAAWVLLQVIDFVLDAISAPNWILQVFILAAAAGFLVVLVFSWVFEFTPEGIRREKDIDRTQSITPQTGRKLDRVIIVFLAVAVVLLLADRFVGTAAESVGGRSRPSMASAAPVHPAQWPLPADSRAERAPTYGESTNPPAGGRSAAEKPGAPVAEKETSAAERPPTRENAPDSSTKSIAVLPFLALSSGPDDEYFADGLTEEILNALAQLPELLVTARTSAFHFKGRDIPIQEIAATLGVSNIVEGSVRRSGERLRVTAQLIRAQDGFHLWSEDYDSTSTDSIAVQEMIAEKIAQAMNVVMDDKKRAAMKNSGLRDGETFIAFQKGQELYESAHGESERISTLRRANRYLEVVMERAPDYPPAYGLHSDLYVHILMDHATNKALKGVTEQEIADAMSHVTSDYQTAIEHARSFEERNNLELDYAILTSDWGGMSGRLETFLSEDGCNESNWADIFLNAYSYASRTRARQREFRLCDPFSVDSWEVEVVTAMWAGDAPAAMDLARQGLLIVPGKKLTEPLILALLADARYDEVETVLADPVLSPELVSEFTFRLAAARGDREVAQHAGEKWLDFFTTDGNGDYQILLFSAMMGDLHNANRVAAQFDQHHFGSLALLDVVINCVCGAPWDLSATPAFAARFRETGFSWPPVSPIKFPLKNW